MARGRTNVEMSVLLFFGFLIAASRVQLHEAASVDKLKVDSGAKKNVIHFPEEPGSSSGEGTVTGNETNIVTRNVPGNLTGNVTRRPTENVTGNVTDKVTGNVGGKVSSIPKNNTAEDDNVKIPSGLRTNATGNVTVEPYFIIDAPIREDDDDHGCSNGQRWSFGHCRDIIE